METSDTIDTYYNKRFFQDISTNESALDIINSSLINVNQTIDDKVLFVLEASILSELCLLQIDKLASATYMPCDEDNVDDQSLFWDIEVEAPLIPIDLWASGIGK